MTRILVVDDDVITAGTLRSMLMKAENREVLLAHNGPDGIETARKFQPHLIILDVLMPEMDGIAVLRTLKQSKETQAIPVIMLTGTNDPEAVSKSMFWYAEQYLHKPIDLSTLEGAVTRVLSSRSMPTVP